MRVNNKQYIVADFGFDSYLVISIFIYPDNVETSTYDIVFTSAASAGDFILANFDANARVHYRELHELFDNSNNILNVIK